jgi:putative phage-type endonuclease
MEAQLLTRESWLAERAKGIGASEVGTILGLNPYESAFELYLRKTGQLPAKDESLAMWLGHEMEPIIARRYEMETGRMLADPGDFAVLPHPDYPWLRSTLDRVTEFEDGEVGPVELKSIGIDRDGDWLDGRAPLRYQPQPQIQMACMGATQAELVAIVGNRDFVIVRLERNDEFLDAIIPMLYEFWLGVQTNRPPDVDGSESCTRALKALHPLDNGETIALPNEFADIIEYWQDLKATRKAAQTQIDLIENQIRAALGDNTFGTVDGLTVSNKTQTRKSYTVADATFRVLRKVGK